MKLKKFTAPTMPEAMQQIRSELGRDAVILQSKEVKKGGVLGFFKKTQMEVVAALDPEPSPKTNNDSYESLTDRNEKEGLIKQNHQVNNNGVNDDTNILSEIKQMRKLLEITSSSAESIPKSLSIDYIVPYTHLIEQEVSPSIAEEIVLSIEKIDEKEQLKDTPQAVKKTLKEELIRRLKDIELAGITFDEHIIHFIGPTGVGKTTTLAKIAAKAKLERNKTVAFITTDTYRISAIEQLKTYARILEVPIEVAYTKEEYDKALKKLEHYDQIYVDTAGRNYRESNLVEDLTELISGPDSGQATMLVLSLSSKAKDIQAIYEQFNHIKNQYIIFTKIDETRQFGSLLNVSLTNERHIAFMTNGQDVPDDIILSSPETIASYIMSGYDDE